MANELFINDGLIPVELAQFEEDLHQFRESIIGLHDRVHAVIDDIYFEGEGGVRRVASLRTKSGYLLKLSRATTHENIKEKDSGMYFNLNKGEVWVEVQTPSSRKVRVAVLNVDGNLDLKCSGLNQTRIWRDGYEHLNPVSIISFNSGIGLVRNIVELFESKS